MYSLENVKCVVMSLRSGTKGFYHGHTLSKQMKMVSQARAWRVWFIFASDSVWTSL